MKGSKVEGNPLYEAIKQLRLTWHLVRDGRVPVWTKLIIPAIILYILFPIDILMDPILGLGQLDDLAVTILGLRLFVEMCPKKVVEEHLKQITSPGVTPRSVEVPSLGPGEEENSKEA